MVRIAGRTAALSIMKIKDQLVTDSVLKSRLVVNLVCFIRDAYVEADKIIIT